MTEGTYMIIVGGVAGPSVRAAFDDVDDQRGGRYNDAAAVPTTRPPSTASSAESRTSDSNH